MQPPTKAAGSSVEAGESELRMKQVLKEQKQKFGSGRAPERESERTAKSKQSHILRSLR